MTAITADQRDPLYARGVAFMLAAGAFASVNGVLFRNIEAATDWQIIFWRNSTMFLFLMGLLILRTRGAVVTSFRAAGKPGLVGGLILGAGNIFFALSIINTTVANALFILSASPFISAILAWFLLREHVQRRTVLAMIVALVGVGVMVMEGLGAGRLFGNIMAVGTTLAHAGFVIALRYGRHTDMLPSIVIAGASAAIVAFGVGGSMAVSWHDFAMCAMMGMGAMSIGFICFTVGSRHVPAAQVALLSLSEVVLGPILVALMVDEWPSFLTLIGGVLVLSAIVGQAVIGMRRSVR
ncbi:MAG: DMT family transporter [Alphaproteobacteria bacterium]|nr:DMT family transporter [Alphaproteobacteria bacterium]